MRDAYEILVVACSDWLLSVCLESDQRFADMDIFIASIRPATRSCGSGHLRVHLL